MEFCPECGAMLLPNNGILKCNSCGYERNLTEENEYEVSGKINETENVKMLGEDVDVGPITTEVCPECGNDRATYKLLQIVLMKHLPVSSHVQNANTLGEHTIKKVFYEKI